MGVTIKEILELIDLNDITVWTVTSKEGDNSKVFDSIEDETLESRKDRFRRVMAVYPGGRFIFRGKKNKTDTRGQFLYEFENNNMNNSNQQTQQNVSINGVPEDKVSQMIQDAINRDREKREVEDLRKKLSEAEKKYREMDTSLNRILMKLGDNIIPIVSGIFGQQVKPATVGYLGLETQPENNGTVQSEVMEIDEDSMNELSSRLEDAIELWGKADPEFIEVIEFISNFAASGDTIDTGFIKLDYKKVKQLLLKK
jgi:hypothetical protein